MRGRGPPWKAHPVVVVVDEELSHGLGDHVRLVPEPHLPGLRGFEEGLEGLV